MLLFQHVMMMDDRNDNNNNNNNNNNNKTPSGFQATAPRRFFRSFACCFWVVSIIPRNKMPVPLTTSDLHPSLIILEWVLLQISYDRSTLLVGV